MSLPCYKINNSYTVYVNYYYLNECKKASKKRTPNGPVKTIRVAQQTTSNNTTPPSVSTAKKAVRFGSIVDLINVDTQETCTWTLVHPDNIDLANQKLSVSSPVGKALIGRYVGEYVSVKIPSGIAQYQILELQN